MVKPFHAAHAARTGVEAALLAQSGFTADAAVLEAPRGFCQTVSTRCDWNEATDALGERFEIAFNTYKPFACGIVIHPSIDAAVQLREQGVRAQDVEQIRLRVHPLVLELTGKKEPQDGLQGKFSFYHGFAAGLIAGRAGESEYSDEFVRREDVTALRRKVNCSAVSTPSAVVSMSRARPSPAIAQTIAALSVCVVMLWMNDLSILILSNGNMVNWLSDE